MTIFEQVINPADIQMSIQPIVGGLSPFLSFFITTVLLFYCLLPKMKFWSRGIENNAYITTVLKALTLSAVIIITLTILFINSFRIIEPLRVPSFEKSYSDTFTSGLFVQNADKPAFIDKYRDDINTAVNTELNEYRILECELDKQNERMTSLLCGGYSFDWVPAVKKDTGETYMLTPKLNYDHDNFTVQLTIKEAKGYKK